MWHGLASDDLEEQQQHQQRQQQQGYPHRTLEREPKWWHVPDGSIEDMIYRLNAPEEAMTNANQGRKPLSSALHRSRSACTPFNRSVQFSTGGLEQDSPDKEDSRDQALQQNQASSQSVQESPKKKKGAWKVPDEQLLEWVQKTQAASALDNFVEEGSDERGSSTLLGKTMLGKLGGSVSTSCLGYNGTGKCNIMGYSRSSRHACKDLSSRPDWSKDYSNPKLFAKVGSGLDGKGNKWISEFQNFAHNPIYLSDRYSSSFENVRIAVCGHPAYMAR